MRVNLGDIDTLHVTDMSELFALNNSAENMKKVPRKILMVLKNRI